MCLYVEHGNVRTESGGTLTDRSQRSAVSVVDNRARNFEFLTNDVAIVATSQNPTTAINGNGQRIPVAGRRPVSKTELFKAPKDGNNLYPPIVGVAVGPSNRRSQTDDGTCLQGELRARELRRYYAERANFNSNSISSPGQTRRRNWTPQNRAGKYAHELSDPGNGGESWIDAVDVRQCPRRTAAMPATSRAIRRHSAV